MGKRDTISLCERDIKILLYLKQNPRCEIYLIAKYFDISYARANNLINKFFDAGYVEKNRKEVIILGKERLEISLSKKGEQFLLEMHEEFEKVFYANKMNKN